VLLVGQVLLELVNRIYLSKEMFLRLKSIISARSSSESAGSPGFESVNVDDLDDLDFDRMSWNNRPVRGELLGTLDMSLGNATTTEKFECPRPSQSQSRGENLVVEFRCVRVDCQVSFSQIGEVRPSMGERFVC
jgi:hypothetical protein